MSKFFAVALDAKGVLLDIEDLPKDIATAARIAVNRAADRARTESAKRVRQQINFPAHYVSPGEGRLAVSDRATDNKLEATISARQRPTSLARFVSGPAKEKQRGARIQVKPGIARYLRNAVFVKLRSGDTDTTNNLGLAIRTKGGVRPNAAYRPVQMRNGMWLLYGPSVSQALLGIKDTGIWPSLTPEIMDNLESEFLRQLDLKNA